MSIKQNKLANDPSPYLQQHKDNPVNWQVWSKDTLETAKKSKKPSYKQYLNLQNY